MIVRQSLRIEQAAREVVDAWKCQVSRKVYLILTIILQVLWGWLAYAVYLMTAIMGMQFFLST